MSRDHLQEIKSFVKDHPEYDTLSVSAIRPKRGTKKDRRLVPVYLHEGKPQEDSERLHRSKRQKFVAMAKLRDLEFDGAILDLHE